jgi:hypothetical protein
VRRKFHLEFYDDQYRHYPFSKQILTLKAIEDFVSHNITFRLFDRAWFGKDSDLERTIRFMQLAILYNQSNSMPYRSMFRCL